MSFREYKTKYDLAWERGATRIICHQYGRYFAYHKAVTQAIVTALDQDNQRPQRPVIPPEGDPAQREDAPPTDQASPYH